MKRILIFLQNYTPAVKGGGPIRSIEGLVYYLCNRFDIYIYTSNHDLGDPPYPGIQSDRWLNLETCKIYYASKNKRIQELYDLVRDIRPDYIYLNGTFPFQFSIQVLIMRKLKKIQNTFILAPRGEYSSGALKLKFLRKRIFIAAAKRCGLFNDIIWHASTQLEKQDILKVYPKANVIIALNLSKPSGIVKAAKQKSENITNLIFLSRISRKKNICFALKTLKKVKSQVIYDIYGPIEDQAYWNECVDLIGTLPSNIKVNYKGIVPSDQVFDIFAKYDFLFLPTLGENFGHVIKESLSVGTPVILSDQTPWRNLSKKNLGWDITGFDPAIYAKTIEKACSLSDLDYQKMSAQAISYIQKMDRDSKRIDDLMNLFA